MSPQLWPTRSTRLERKEKIPTRPFSCRAVFLRVTSLLHFGLARFMDIDMASIVQEQICPKKSSLGESDDPWKCLGPQIYVHVAGGFWPV